MMKRTHAKRRRIVIKQRNRSKPMLVGGKKLNRSTAGNVAMIVFITIFAGFSALPLILAVGMSLKPLNELFVYPPKFLPRNPTLENFRMLFTLMSTTWVPFSRYIFNTVFITVVTTVGHVIVASMAAYPLAKHRFIGKKFINNLIILSLMFVPAVGDVVNYLTMSALGWVDTYFAIIVPFMGLPLGLFLMRNYMTTIPDSIIEASKMEGASHLQTFWMVIMPLVKPAWLTLVIIMFQNVWVQPHSLYIYSEEMKTLPHALSQIVSGGIVRAGAGQAAAVLMMLVPATIFIFSQSKILETMATSGMKE